MEFILYLLFSYTLIVHFTLAYFVDVWVIPVLLKHSLYDLCFVPETQQRLVVEMWT